MIFALWVGVELVHFTISAICGLLDHLLSGVLEGTGHCRLHAMLGVTLHHEDIGPSPTRLVVGVADDLDLREVVSHVCGWCCGSRGGLGSWSCFTKSEFGS